MILRRFGTSVTHAELCSIALVISSVDNRISPPDRNERRSFPLLLKWFDDRLGEILSLLNSVSLLDEDGIPITLEREVENQQRKHSP